ncbi:FeoA family protein [Zavarzinella formosa]|uniref:FeoA family protein n=1 Tax=Zavarzinella formosa TaxID=360055 RepID=UPI0002DE1B42|nr:FeoA family protein [Zavarzinella formosa]
MFPLDCLRAGESADVIDVHGEANWVCRMAELGIRSGSRIQMLQEGTTCLLQVGGCKLCLRSDASSQIMVAPVANSHPVHS